MRRIIAEMAISGDGFISKESGDLDWLIYSNDSFGEELLRRYDTIFYGRKAYEEFGLYQPQPWDDPLKQNFYESVKKMRRYVFSRTLKHVPGNGMVIGREFVREVTRIKEEAGKDIWLCGGATIVNIFAAHNLIDEFTLLIHPVELVEGFRFFSEVDLQEIIPETRLSLIHNEVVRKTFRPIHKPLVLW